MQSKFMGFYFEIIEFVLGWRSGTADRRGLARGFTAIAACIMSCDSFIKRYNNMRGLKTSWVG
jgi:hypothetical protein